MAGEGRFPFRTAASPRPLAPETTGTLPKAVLSRRWEVHWYKICLLRLGGARCAGTTLSCSSDWKMWRALDPMAGVGGLMMYV